MFMFRH